uniref:B30.2/SPRY domain-containing protein n=2 Tax=Schizophyllum commune (strain H4-8 / FGSC 9210) TaxID=578458 RepID=D8QKH9_SCHCM
MSPFFDSDDDESTASGYTGRPAAKAPSPPAIAADEVLKLPSRWSEQMRHPLLSVSPDGRELSYEGISCSGDRDAAAARTNVPIPPACGIYYYEVTIISKGQKGHISIGFAGKDVKLARLPGWEPHSYGYHGDDGLSFAAQKDGTPYGPVFGTGDVIGCGIDFTMNRAFYTKNGAFIGHVFDNVGKTFPLYPSVGLRHAGEMVRVNFGHEPFRFEIEHHVLQQKATVWNRILETPVDVNALARGIKQEAEEPGPASERDVSGALHQLVMSYLAHHGYTRTARALRQQAATRSSAKADTDMDADADDADVVRRTGIVKAVNEGDIERAIEQTRAHYPGVLDADDGIMLFKLRCRRFVEMILEAAEEKKRAVAEGAVDGAVGSFDTLDDDDEEDDSMDIDEGATALNGGSSSESTMSAHERALQAALLYGRALWNDYKRDPRPEVRALSERTFGIVAFDDPLEAGGIAAEVAGHAARTELGNELNQAILKSQGSPAHPPLEMLFRQVSACVQELGLLGVGEAAFADVPGEFLDA